MRDKKADKRGIVNLKVKAVDGDRLRLDVTSAVGTHVASILVNGQDMKYLIVAEKKYVESKANKESVREVLKVPLEPTVLFNVLFDKPIEQKSWSCTSDEKGFLTSCKELKTGLKIDWVMREGAKRTVSIEHSSASVQLNLFDFEPKIENPEKSFELAAPAGFRVIKR